MSAIENPTERCDVCGQDIQKDRYSLHARGLDGARPECARQDLVEIALRSRVTWGGRTEWDAMRRRYSDKPARSF
jgi:hypothetical protein